MKAESMVVPGTLNIVTPVMKKKSQMGKVMMGKLMYFTHSHTQGVGELA